MVYGLFFMKETNVVVKHLRHEGVFGMTIRSPLVLAGILAVCMGIFFPSWSPSNSSAVNTAASVLEYHNNPKRDGLYIDSSMSRASAATFHIDPTFKAHIQGAVYAQLLYVAGGAKGKDIIIAAAESDNVAAFDAGTGATVWTRKLGNPVPLTKLPCGNINPLGITGTPVINIVSQTIFLDAMTTPDGGATKKHLVFALSLKDGTTLSGWPVDVSAKAAFGSMHFDSSVQNQRGALAFVKGTVYVPYGGFYGDCGRYHGWLVGIPVANPAAVKAWATGALGGGSSATRRRRLGQQQSFYCYRQYYARQDLGRWRGTAALRRGPCVQRQACRLLYSGGLAGAR